MADRYDHRSNIDVLHGVRDLYATRKIMAGAWRSGSGRSGIEDRMRSFVMGGEAVCVYQRRSDQQTDRAPDKARKPFHEMLLESVDAPNAITVRSERQGITSRADTLCPDHVILTVVTTVPD